VRAPREPIVAAPGVPAVAVATAAYGFPLELIMNWFLIIQPFDRAAVKVLGHRVTSAGELFRAFSDTPDRHEN